jgi:hypothetical protein
MIAGTVVAPRANSLLTNKFPRDSRTNELEKGCVVLSTRFQRRWVDAVFKGGRAGVNSGVPGAKMLAPEKQHGADEDEEGL